MKLNKKPVEKMTLQECEIEATGLMKKTPEEIAKEPNAAAIIKRARDLYVRAAVLIKMRNN